MNILNAEGARREYSRVGEEAGAGDKRDLDVEPTSTHTDPQEMRS